MAPPKLWELPPLPPQRWPSHTSPPSKGPVAATSSDSQRGLGDGLLSRWCAPPCSGCSVTSGTLGGALAPAPTLPPARCTLHAARLHACFPCAPCGQYLCPLVVNCQLPARSHGLRAVQGLIPPFVSSRAPGIAFRIISEAPTQTTFLATVESLNVNDPGNTNQRRHPRNMLFDSHEHIQRFRIDFRSIYSANIDVDAALYTALMLDGHEIRLLYSV